ncbi:MAG: hypothetical protein JWM10_3035 [Myxococcaceae bacterium]|nr:hypothetical protein [Myxococcaceae bacterium]
MVRQEGRPINGGRRPSRQRSSEGVARLWIDDGLRTVIERLLPERAASSMGFDARDDPPVLGVVC